MGNPRSLRSVLGCLVLGWLALGGCKDGPDGPPGGRSPATNEPTEVDVVEAPTCEDIGAERGWGVAVCEAPGSGACGGKGEATSDCARCCEGALPTSAELAKQLGWAAVACEKDGDGSCYGLGEPTSDCEVACEVPATPRTCAQVAAEWEFESTACENGGNAACGGVGVVTSDCARCCEAPGGPGDDSLPEFGEEPEEDLTEADLSFPPALDDEEAEEAAEPLDPGEPGAPAEPDGSDLPHYPEPIAPPSPDKPCGVIGSEMWPGYNSICETSSNQACDGQGYPSSDCKLCCPGEPSDPPTPKTCGNNVCSGGETCATCPQDCGKCLTAVSYNLTDVSSSAQILKVARELKKSRPTVVGLQQAKPAYVNFLAGKLGMKGAAKDRKPFIHKGESLGLMSTLPLQDRVAERLPGKKDVLLRADVRTALGPITFGATRLSDGQAKAPATRVRNMLSDEHAMLAVSFDDGSFKPALDALEKGLPDGWRSKFGPGKTTDERRQDFVLRGKGWNDAIDGDVAGTPTKTRRAAVAQTYSPQRLGTHCARPATLAAVGQRSGRSFGTTLYPHLAETWKYDGAQIEFARRKASEIVARQFDQVTINEYFNVLRPSVSVPDPADASKNVETDDQKTNPDGSIVENYGRVIPLLDFLAQQAAAGSPVTTVRYHPLLWDTSVYANDKLTNTKVPRWFLHLARQGKQAEMVAALDDYLVRTVQAIQGYPGAPPVSQIVVLNEAMSDGGTLTRNSFWQAMPDTSDADRYRYVVHAFEKARAAARPGTVLMYNDFGAEFMVVEKKVETSKKALGVFKMVEWLRQRRLIDAVGFQTHLKVTRVLDTNSKLDEEKLAGLIRQLKANIQRYARLGVDVYITEFDLQYCSVSAACKPVAKRDSDGKVIKGPDGKPLPAPRPVTPVSDALRRRLFTAFAQACGSTRGCKGFTTWGTTDDEKWTIEDFGGDAGQSRDGNQLYSAVKEPFSFRPNAPTTCGAIEGLMQHCKQQCATFAPAPGNAFPCDELIYGCR